MNLFEMEIAKPAGFAILRGIAPQIIPQCCHLRTLYLFSYLLMQQFKEAFVVDFIFFFKERLVSAKFIQSFLKRKIKKTRTHIRRVSLHCVLNFIDK